MDTRVTWRSAAGLAELLPWADFVAQHHEQWLRLWRDTGSAPDLAPHWAMALVSAHQLPTDSLHVASLRSGDGLSLVWPFQAQPQRRFGLPTQQIRPVQNVFCLHGGILTSLPLEDAVHRLLHTLVAAPLRWDWMLLDTQECPSPLHDAWTAAAADVGVGLLRSGGIRSPYLRHHGTFDELLASRSRNFREKMRARRRDLTKDPRLKLVYYTAADEMPRYLEAVKAVEPHTWKQAEGTSITSRDWEMRYYEHLLAAFAPLGMVNAGVLYLDDAPIAHSLDLRQGDRVFGLKWSFNAAHAKLRPGVLMMVDRLERYFAEGVTEYDFTGEDEPYKLQWSPTTRDHEALKLFAPTLTGRLLLAVERARAWAQQRRQAAPPPPGDEASA